MGLLSKIAAVATNPVGALSTLAGGAAMGGQAVSAYADYKSQQETNKTNIGMANQQMQFQERMSSTAHTREMADYKEAGLNPMLAMKGGAAMGSGAATNIQAPTIGDKLNANIATALNTARMKKEFSQADASIALNRAQAKSQATQQKLNVASAKVAKANENKLKAQLPGIHEEALYKRDKAGIDRKLIILDSILGRATSAIGAAAGVKFLGSGMKGMSGTGWKKAKKSTYKDSPHYKPKKKKRKHHGR